MARLFSIRNDQYREVLRILFFPAITFLTLQGHSQLSFLQQPGKVYVLTSNLQWSHSTHATTYENQGEMHSEYLALNLDGTFVFVGHYEPWNGFTKGKWFDLGHSKISLTWDQKGTDSVITNPDSCAKYKIRDWSRALVLNDLTLLRKDDSLITLAFEGDRMSLIERIEKHALKTDSVKHLWLSDTSSIDDMRGNKMGSRIVTYFYNKDEDLIKYIAQSAYTNKDGETSQASEIVYLLAPDLMKYSKWTNNSVVEITSRYFLGQKVIFSTKPDRDDVAYSIIKIDSLQFELRIKRLKKLSSGKREKLSSK